MITKNLSTLKIHKLTQAQYDREREAGRLDEEALYIKTDEASGEISDRLQALEDYVDGVKSGDIFVKNASKALLANSVLATDWTDNGDWNSFDPSTFEFEYGKTYQVRFIAPRFACWAVSVFTTFNTAGYDLVLPSISTLFVDEDTRQSKTAHISPHLENNGKKFTGIVIVDDELTAFEDECVNFTYRIIN